MWKFFHTKPRKPYNKALKLSFLIFIIVQDIDKNETITVLSISLTADQNLRIEQLESIFVI